MRRLLLALAILILPVAASAQIGVAGGGTQDWILMPGSDQWSDAAVTFMPAIEYTISGTVLAYRGSEDGDSIQEFGVGARRGKWYGQAIFETFGPQIAGDRKFLVGGRLGIRGDALEGLPVELSIRYSVEPVDRDSDGRAGHLGVFFGLYK
jgi:hypothetical protein